MLCEHSNLLKNVSSKWSSPCYFLFELENCKEMATLIWFWKIIWPSEGHHDGQGHTPECQHKTHVTLIPVCKYEPKTSSGKNVMASCKVFALWLRRLWRNWLWQQHRKVKLLFTQWSVPRPLTPHQREPGERERQYCGHKVISKVN